MSESQFQRPKGTADILPFDQNKWQKINQVVDQVIQRKYMFSRIDTPLFENFEVFSRSAGETSDVVSKEMYDFHDKGDRHIALRPEGTAGVVRAYVENKLFGPEHDNPLNVFYMGPMYRYERPQAGRMREFHQLGVESLGSNSPILDADIIQMSLDFLIGVGMPANELKVVINSLGDDETRNNYRAKLVDFLNGIKDQLSEDSKTRLQSNPLRILDSKDKNDIELIKDAPKLEDSFTDEARARFEIVQQALTNLGIEFSIDNNLVRGLDYYSHTIFEIKTTDPKLGSSSTIIGGGRYESLVEEFGGPQTSAIGFAVGLERLISLMPEPDPQTILDVFIVQADEGNELFVSGLTNQLRNDFDLSVKQDYNHKSMKSQFKTADKQKARYTIVIGNQEVESKTIAIKNMNSGEQQQVALGDLTKELFKD